MGDVVEALEYYASKAPKDNKWIGEALEKARKDQEFIEAFDKFYLESKPTEAYRRYWNEMLQAWKARSE